VRIVICAQAGSSIRGPTWPLPHSACGHMGESLARLAPSAPWHCSDLKPLLWCERRTELCNTSGIASRCNITCGHCRSRLAPISLTAVRGVRVQRGNVVLGVALGLSTDTLWPFVRTLRLHSDDDLVLMVKSVSSALRQMGAAHRIAYDTGMTTTLRYLWYAQRCSHYSGLCLALDTKDVVFQANPFQHPLAARVRRELILFEEAPVVTIGSCEHNSRWVREACPLFFRPPSRDLK
jgi:hypothetical protein